MKAALINGSPKIIMQKADPCASHALLQSAKRYMRRSHIHDLEEFHIKTPVLTETEMAELMTCDIWLFSFPLYTGGIPSHLLRFLMNMQAYAENWKKSGKCREGGEKIYVYAIVNCGLYEGSETRPAMEMMEHWCDESGFVWGSGLGVGGGITYANPHVFSFALRKWHSLGRAMTSFGMAIGGTMSAGNFYCSPDISKKAYIISINRFLKKWQKEATAATVRSI